MFYRVLKTFVSFLAWFSLFIIAFAFSFYILLHDDNGDSDKEYPFFDAVGLTLVKTFSMFVGELEFSNIPLNSAFSYVFFLLFVFLIVVVLMNLLNGLAVSDTQKIRSQAEILALESRLKTITQIEATLPGVFRRILKINLFSPDKDFKSKYKFGWFYCEDKKLVIFPNKLSQTFVWNRVINIKYIKIVDSAIDLLNNAGLRKNPTEDLLKKLEKKNG